MFGKKHKPLKNLCHKARLGEVESVDMSIRYSSKDDGSSQASRFSYIEFEAMTGGKKEIYRSKSQNTPSCQNIEGDYGKIIDNLWKYAFTITMVPKAKRIAKGLIDYGCDVTFEGEPYNDSLLDDIIRDTMMPDSIENHADNNS